MKLYAFLIIALIVNSASAKITVGDQEMVNGVGTLGMGMGMGQGGMVGPMPQGFYPTLGKDAQEKSAVSSTGSLVNKAIDYIPDSNLKSGLQEYMKIVNPEAYQGDSSVGGSNRGISAYFTREYQKNKCFQDAAKGFYDDIRATLKKNNQCDRELDKTKEASVNWLELMKNGLMDSCKDNRAKLTDQAGVGDKKDYKEGWVLDLAMKHANGNPEAALQLIGMCGHDDVAQGAYSYWDSSDAAKDKVKNQVEQVKAMKKKMDAKLKASFAKFDASDEEKQKTYILGQQASYLNSQIQALQSQKGMVSVLECPAQSSDFYLPGSLSASADIPKALKDKIMSVQDPEKEKHIPGKYYHVYGSAFLGCKMVEKGMSPETAVTVQKQAARLYRGIRMCEANNRKIKDSEQIAKSLGVSDLNDTKTIQDKVLKVWTDELDGKVDCSKFDKETMQKCNLLYQFNIKGLKKDEKEIVLQKIEGYVGQGDAAQLYSDWYFGGGSIAGKNLPCSDVRYKGPKDLMNPNEGILGKLFKPSGWSDERYKKASQKVATYDVDFEWTVAQHEAGSAFGAKLCANAKNKKNPFADKACEITAGYNGYNPYNPGQGGYMGFPGGGMMGISNPGVK
ncbi:hypothetical protein [Bdellovibrio sp. NC01]|uniref:hypothetical protein n=1 Tax=Bdellovibrio sp. NC01 TaxID=2220073 RepID=UPI001159A971|nr:hypothetical protein [Bdellovibrio sp. NC01]QDK38173.1 hypothetical protein DOE51_11560 [Bdellovibrio sp. NC01]